MSLIDHDSEDGIVFLAAIAWAIALAVIAALIYYFNYGGA